MYAGDAELIEEEELKRVLHSGIRMKSQTSRCSTLLNVVSVLAPSCS